MHQRVGGTQPGKLFVHLETLFEPAAAGVIVAENLKGFNVSRIALDNAFEEINLNVKIAFLFAAQFLSALRRHKNRGDNCTASAQVKMPRGRKWNWRRNPRRQLHFLNPPWAGTGARRGRSTRRVAS